MKIGVIGIGDIAQKAYLPVLCTTPNHEFYFATRDASVLSVVGEKYRVENRFHTAQELIEQGVDAVFIHAATSAHETLVETFLNHGIHVFVDKPLTSDYQSSARLVRLAKEKGLLLMVGFNRRFAPMYAQLKGMPRPDVIIMQKNRAVLPGLIRSTVMDDFIHVVDTLRFLLPGDTESVVGRGRLVDGLLSYVYVELVSEGTTAIGIMHRNTGHTEEKLEVISQGEKRVVRSLTETVHLRGGEKLERFGDWTPTLTRRGFRAMIDEFLAAVSAVCENPEQVQSVLSQSSEDALKTHAVCEEIIRQIEATEAGR